MSNKELAKRTQLILKEQGHEVSLGHAYELLAKLAGFNSWNVAAAKASGLHPIIAHAMTNDSDTIEAVNENLPAIRPLFEVEVSTGKDTDDELYKEYVINAKDADEARAVLKEYIDIRSGEIEESDAKYPQTKHLLKIEDENDYNYKNWKVGFSKYADRVSAVREKTLYSKAKPKEEQEQGDDWIKEMQDKMTPGNWCYYATEQSKGKGGYIPVIVIRDVPGYYPMGTESDDPMKPLPWYWGSTLKECQEACDAINIDKFGLDREKTKEIFTSSVRAQNLNKEREEARSHQR